MHAHVSFVKREQVMFCTIFSATIKGTFRGDASQDGFNATFKIPIERTTTGFESSLKSRGCKIDQHNLL